LVFFNPRWVFFFLVCKKAAKAFDLLWIWNLFFQSCHGLEVTIWLLHWKLFGDLHCWCFLTSTLILNPIIPHFSLTHVFGVCGMNNKSVIKMMNERRCHYYVFGSLFQIWHGLEAIWPLHWEIFGNLHCWCFLKGTITLSLVIPSFLSCKCAWVFFTICKIRPFLSIMYLGLFLQSYHGLETIYYIESFLRTYICWCFLASMIESCNSPFLSCNYVCSLWHK